MMTKANLPTDVRGRGVLSDETLFERMLAGLEQSGHIEFSGEFGYEIATFIPLVAWLKQEGHLKNRAVVTYSGMAPYYFFLDAGQLIEKQEKRKYIPGALRNYPTHRTNYASLKPWHAPPDYRTHYAPRARRYSRPTLVIQNKFAVEWNMGPINYIPLIDLAALLNVARDRFQVVYSRPGELPSEAGYSSDERFCHYPDRALLRRYPKALILEDMVRQEGRPFNEVKLEVLAGAHLFFAVQGGGAHLLAAFRDSFLAVIHRRGTEHPFAYERGLYKYLSTPPPELLVARTDEEIRQAVCLFGALDVEDGRVVRRGPPTA